MFNTRYALITSLFLLSFACNHENERDPASGSDADARAPSSSEAMPSDNAANFDTGGTENRANDVPGPVGGTGIGGFAGGVGRSANDGSKDAAPSTIGSTP